MKTKTIVGLIALLSLLSGILTVFAQGTAFTYQGQLNNNGAPANGSYDFRFRLASDPYGNNYVDGPVVTNGVAVSNGLFLATLDFGGVFAGANYWLEVDVRTNGAGGYAALSPLQPLTPAPYAIMATTASNLLGTLPLAQLGAGTASISITGSAATALNGVVTTGTYADPAWVTSLGGGKIAGNIPGNAAGFTGSLAGDVTGTQGATVVTNVGGQSAANVASGASAANNATSANTPGTIVKRDGSGNFSAGAITGSSFSGDGSSLTGLNASALASGTVPDVRLSANAALLNGTNIFTGTNTFAASLIATNPANQIAGVFNGNGAGLTNLNPANLAAGTANINISGSAASFTGSLAGDVAGAQAATAVASVGGQTAANVASGAIAANNATSANTPSTIVKRDASGNFSAGTITASLLGNAASATTANNFSGSLSGNVTGTQGATVVGTVGGVSAASVALGANAANNATSANSASTIVKRDGSGNFAAQTITLSGQLALPATVSSSVGVVSISGIPFLHGYALENTFVGMYAGNFTMSGRDNTASGFYALAGSTSGSYNTANGAFALEGNTSGSYNTANGYYALGYNTNGSRNTANGFTALYSNANGSDNTANGYDALAANTFGSDNTANGSSALAANTSGSENTANGYHALCVNTMGTYNTANGSGALSANTNGWDNTANGYYALGANTSGYDNTANGFGALPSNSTGRDNTANGYDTLFDNTTGYENTAEGAEALYSNTTGSDNTAIGTAALWSNTTGSENTAIGWQALDNYNGSGQWNIALGGQAGYNVTSGSGNIDIGSPGVNGDNYTIRIGNTALGGWKTFIAGISGTTISPSGGLVYVNANGQLGTINSSRRFKEAIQDMASLSDLIFSLRPVAFHYKPDLDPERTPQYGLIAEEVEKVAPQLVLRDAKGEVLSVRYEQVNAMLLNEFLKEHQKVEAQDTEIQELKQSVAELKAMVEKLAGE